MAAPHVREQPHRQIALRHPIQAAAQLLAYEFKPGREDLLAGYMEGRTRRELRAAGHGLSA